jgi:ElaB/YqjD/DUF883 family membrane-anchored ribosome-binding protein
MIDTLNEALAGQEIHEEMAAIRNDMRQLRSDMAELLRTVVQAGRTETSEAGAALRDEAAKRLERMRDALKHAREYSERAVNETREQIQQRPFLAIAGAMALGFLAGRILRHKA